MIAAGSSNGPCESLPSATREITQSKGRKKSITQSIKRVLTSKLPYMPVDLLLALSTS